MVQIHVCHFGVTWLLFSLLSVTWVKVTRSNCNMGRFWRHHFFIGYYQKCAGNWFEIQYIKESHSGIRHNPDPVSRANSSTVVLSIAVSHFPSTPGTAVWFHIEKLYYWYGILFVYCLKWMSGSALSSLKHEQVNVVPRVSLFMSPKARESWKETDGKKRGPGNKIKADLLFL